MSSRRSRAARSHWRRLETRGEATLSLYDVSGRRLLVRSVHSEGGEQSVSLSGAGSLEPGIYLLALDVAGSSVSRRVIRTR